MTQPIQPSTDQAVTPETAAPGHTRRRRRHGWVSVSVLLAIAMGMLGWHGWLWLSIQGRLAALNEAGQPLGLATAIPAPLTEGTENAAVTIQEAFALYPSVATDPDDGMAVPFLEPSGLQAELSPAVIAEMTAVLERHGEALALMDVALQQRDFIYTRDFMHGYNTPMPIIQKLRRGVALYGIRAVQAAEAGDGDGAVRDLRLAIRLTESLRRDRSVLAFATRLSCRPIVYEASAWVMSRNILDAKQMRDLCEAMGEFEDPGAIYDAMVVERAQAVDAISRMSDTGETVYAQLDGQNWDSGETFRVRAMGLHRLSLLRYLEAMDDMSAAVTLPLPDRLDATMLASQAFDALPPAGVARAMVFEGQVYTAFEALQLARARCIQAMLLTLSGADAADAAWPVDPYTGEAIRMLRRDGRIYTYSVGINRRDDGGNPQLDPALHGDGPPMDIVFDLLDTTDGATDD